MLSCCVSYIFGSEFRRLKLASFVNLGEVDTSISGVVKYDRRVPMLINNESVVQLRDSFSNPIVSNQSKLTLLLLRIFFHAYLGFLQQMLSDNNISIRRQLLQKLLISFCQLTCLLNFLVMHSDLGTYWKQLLLLLLRPTALLIWLIEWVLSIPQSS
ncbi:hypothetical protein ACET3Z_024410 [Daucus carota]